MRHPIQTHTHANMEVSDSTYTEIHEKLKASGYEHAFGSNGSIDMYGIALVRKERKTNEPPEFYLRLKVSMTIPTCCALREKGKTCGVYVCIDLKKVKCRPDAVACQLQNAVMTLDRLVRMHYRMEGGLLILDEGTAVEPK